MIPAACILTECCIEKGKTLKILAVTLFCAAAYALYDLSFGADEVSMLMTAFLTSALSLVSGGPLSAFACCAAAPVLAVIFVFIAELFKYDYAALEFTADTVDAQMTGIVFAAVLYEIYTAVKNHIGKREILMAGNEPGKRGRRKRAG